MNTLTVIVPVAPRDMKYAPRALETILKSAQDLYGRVPRLEKDVDVRVVIDGPCSSQDQTRLLSMQEEFDEGATNVRFEMLPKPMGAGVARNYALATTPPESLVAFLDADDEVYPHCFYTRVDAFWNTLLGVQALGMGMCEPFVYTQNVYRIPHPEKPNQILQQVRDLPHPHNVKVWIEQQNVFLTTSILCRAALLQDAGGFEPHMVCGEDGCLWRRAVLANGVILTPVTIPTHTYTVRPDSQCRKTYFANEKSYHLEPPVHGAMGQALDRQAEIRALSWRNAVTDAQRIAALCTESLEAIVLQRERVA